MRSMVERFTNSAKRAIYFSRFQAIHRDMPAMSPEDLLLGLIWDSETRAERVAGLKENALDLRAKLGVSHFPITSIPYGEKRDLRLTKEAKLAIIYAIEEANRDCEFEVDTDHLLRGLLRVRSAPSGLLKESGYSLKSLRNASQDDRKKNPTGKPPWYWKPPFLYSRADVTLAITLTTIIFLVVFGVVRALMRAGFGKN